MVENENITSRLHKRQGEVLLSEANEILYGGAAGGGKSHLMRVPMFQARKSREIFIGALRGGHFPQKFLSFI